MVDISVLSDGEFAILVDRLAEWSQLDREDLTEDHLTEMEVSDGDVEIRAFPKGTKPDFDDTVYFEVTVDEGAEWYDDSLGTYGPDNLRNGGLIYQQLAYELHDAVYDGLSYSGARFSANKGSDTFTAEVPR